jgi:hypothetical protein
MSSADGLQSTLVKVPKLHERYLSTTHSASELSRTLMSFGLSLPDPTARFGGIFLGRVEFAITGRIDKGKCLR